jgi:hypothetical protein
VGVPINFTADNDAAIITQIVVPGAGTSVGKNLTIQAQAGQNQSGSNDNNNGGDLTLSSGAPGIGGTLADGEAGSIKLQAAGITIAEVDENKFYVLKGFNRNVTQITANYTILPTDNIIAVGAITASITVYLPSSSSVGDTYLVKDTTGISNIHNIIISGNGNNIDGTSSYTMSNDYECLELTFTIYGWSII